MLKYFSHWSTIFSTFIIICVAILAFWVLFKIIKESYSKYMLFKREFAPKFARKQLFTLIHDVLMSLVAIICLSFFIGMTVYNCLIEVFGG